ncbi:hypothetical protein ACTJKC_09040 [Pedobacter sp. 22226]|uniref:hypothetical protein n=1 Tax=Pedobacter sp. 22226 TaxID=3453894 RepID=UPI003F841036
MKQTYFILLFFLFTGSASAQITDALNRNLEEYKAIPDQKIRICAPSRAGIITNQPLYVVNKVAIKNTGAFEYLSPLDIVSIKVLKSEEEVKAYGPNAKNGVIEITLNNNIELLSLAELFKNYKIKKKYRNLPVFIGEKKVTDTHDFYLANNIVMAIEVIKTNNTLEKDRFIKIWLKPL